MKKLKVDCGLNSVLFLSGCVVGKTCIMLEQRFFFSKGV